MRELSAADLLLVWERGRNLAPVHQAIEILAGAFPGRSHEDLYRLTVGQRDAALLSLREATFGSQIRGVTECPCCGLKLEVSFAVSDVVLKSADEPLGEVLCEGEDYALRLRLPSTADIVAVLQTGNEPRANALFHLCLLSATQAGQPAAELPAGWIDQVSSQISDADPQADVQVAVSCSSCRHEWSVLFDIVSFFWEEIECCAARLLGQVHALASVYGWSERDILSLSPLRRQSYLEAAGV